MKVYTIIEFDRWDYFCGIIDIYYSKEAAEEEIRKLKVENVENYFCIEEFDVKGKA